MNKSNTLFFQIFFLIFFSTNLVIASAAGNPLQEGSIDFSISEQKQDLINQLIRAVSRETMHNSNINISQSPLSSPVSSCSSGSVSTPRGRDLVTVFDDYDTQREQEKLMFRNSILSNDFTQTLKQLYRNKSLTETKQLESLKRELQRLYAEDRITYNEIVDAVYNHIDIITRTAELLSPKLFTYMYTKLDRLVVPRNLQSAEDMKSFIIDSLKEKIVAIFNKKKWDLELMPLLQDYIIHRLMVNIKTKIKDILPGNNDEEQVPRRNFATMRARSSESDIEQ